jgi:hypothetical protein
VPSVSAAAATAGASQSSLVWSRPLRLNIPWQEQTWHRQISVETAAKQDTPPVLRHGLGSSQLAEARRWLRHLRVLSRKEDRPRAAGSDVTLLADRPVGACRTTLSRLPRTCVA